MHVRSISASANVDDRSWRHVWDAWGRQQIPLEHVEDYGQHDSLSLVPGDSIL